MASADLNKSMNRLNLTISSDKDSNSDEHADDAPIPPSSSDAINQVDQFLLDAIQNPRQRLTSEFSPFHISL